MVPVQKYVQIMENASVLNVHVKRLLEELVRLCPLLTAFVLCHLFVLAYRILTKSIMEISVNVTILTA